MNLPKTAVLSQILILLFAGATVCGEAKIVCCIDTDLYVMNDDGSRRHRLTHNTTAKDGHPRWSPDGTQIAFIRYMDKEKIQTSSELFIMNADGTEPHRLTDNNVADGYPSWSPDGTKIAFSSTLSGNFEVYVIDVATLAVTQLTFAEERQGSGAPDWSPDGTQITFERFIRVGVGFGGKKIYVMSADGQHQRPLQRDWRIGDDGSSMQFEPRWSADGQRILFDDCKWHGDELTCRLTVVRLGGGGRVIQEIYDRLGDNLRVSYVGWMENDRAILFAMKRLDKPAPNYDLYRYAFDTRSLRRLTREASDEKYPDWIVGALSVSPEGKLPTQWGQIKHTAAEHP